MVNLLALSTKGLEGTRQHAAWCQKSSVDICTPYEQLGCLLRTGLYFLPESLYSVCHQERGYVFPS